MPGPGLHARVSDVRDPRRVDRLDLLEPGLGVAEVVEQPCAASEHHGDDRDDELVQQTCRQVLLRHARTAADRQSLSPAAARACSSADSIPSVTK